jgi:hypothetical protein
VPVRRNLAIDLDNTIVDYDALFAAVCRQFAQVSPSAASKNAVRDLLRGMPDGEQIWVRVQAIVYGERMAEARLIDGVRPFLAECRRHRLPVHIISHKTRYAAADCRGIDLREASRRWLSVSGVLDAGGLAMDDVFFEDTRADKISRIRALGCTCFIDDLEEVFAEPGFPAGLDRILFDPADAHPAEHCGLTVCRSWPEIFAHVFGDR